MNININDVMFKILDVSNSLNITDTEKELFKEKVIKIFIDLTPIALTAEDFKNKLTETELLALQSIIEETGENGYMVVSYLCQKTGISRPVYNIVLSKLKTYGIAQIKNRGTRGMSVKFINQDVIEKMVKNIV